MRDIFRFTIEKKSKYLLDYVLKVGWWRSWLARRSHSYLSEPEVESPSLSHPKIICLFFSFHLEASSPFLCLFTPF